MGGGNITDQHVFKREGERQMKLILYICTDERVAFPVLRFARNGKSDAIYTFRVGVGTSNDATNIGSIISCARRLHYV